MSCVSDLLLSGTAAIRGLHYSSPSTDTLLSDSTSSCLFELDGNKYYIMSCIEEICEGEK